MNYKQTQRYKKRGWFGESHRHYLAAKGIPTKYDHTRYFFKGAKRVDQLRREDFPSDEAWQDFKNRVGRAEVRPRMVDEDIIHLIAAKELALKKYQQPKKLGGVIGRELDFKDPDDLEIRNQIFDEVDRKMKSTKNRLNEVDSLIKSIDVEEDVDKLKQLRKEMKALRESIAVGLADPAELELKQSEYSRLKNSVEADLAKRASLKEEKRQLVNQVADMVGEGRTAKQIEAFTTGQVLKKRYDSPFELLNEIPDGLMSQEDRVKLLTPRFGMLPTRRGGKVENEFRLETEKERDERVFPLIVGFIEANKDVLTTRGEAVKKLRSTTMDEDPTLFGPVGIGKGRRGDIRIPEVAVPNVARIQELQSKFAEQQQQDAPADMKTELKFGEVDVSIGQAARRLDRDVAPKDDIRRTTQKKDFSEDVVRERQIEQAKERQKQARLRKRSKFLDDADPDIDSDEI